MSKEIDSDALLTINRVLGIAGPGSASTELEDGTLVQVMNMNDIVRRSRAIGPFGGWYQGLLENVHSAGDTESSFIDPYEPGASANAPYPASVPLGWDVWIVGVGGVRSSGAGALADAIMQINPIARQTGWGQDNAGAPVTGSPSFSLAHFDDVVASVGSIVADPMKNGTNGLTYYQPNVRVPRGAAIEFHSTSGAAAEFQAQFLMGIFPQGLGQDVSS